MKSSFGLLLTAVIAAVRLPGALAQGTLDRPSSPPDSWLLAEGRRLCDARKYDEAIERLTQLVEKMPDSALAENEMGIAYFEAGRNAKAVEALNHTVHLKPGSSTTHYNLGLAYKRMGRRAAAITSLQRAIGLDPGHLEAYAYLAEIYIDEKNYEEGSKPFARRSGSNRTTPKHITTSAQPITPSDATSTP